MRFPIFLTSPIQVLKFLFHLPNLIRLISRLAGDPRVPSRNKMILYFGFLYFILPLDLLRDFPLVYLGYLDDLMVMYFCIRTFLRKCPKQIVQEHIEALENAAQPQQRSPG